MALLTKTRIPGFRLQIHTRGTLANPLPFVYDSADPSSTLRETVARIQFSRRMGAGGAFIIELLPNTANTHGAVWQDAVSPMDFVDIQLSPAALEQPTHPPARFRGFVDSVTLSFSMFNGKPRPLIVIRGRDYAKLAADARMYLLGDVPPQYAAVVAFLQGYAQLMNEKNNRIHVTEKPKSTTATGSAPGLTPSQVIQFTWDYFFVKFIRAIEQTLSVQQLSGFLHSYADQDAANLNLGAILPPGVTNNFDPLATTVWDVMRQYSHIPWYELFFEDYEDGPFLILRPTPWRNISGQWARYTTPTGSGPISSVYDALQVAPTNPGAAYAKASQGAPSFIQIMPQEVEALALSRHDTQEGVSNFFLTYGAPFEMLTKAGKALNVNLGGGVLLMGSDKTGMNFTAPYNFAATSDWHVFGMRPFEATTPYVSWDNASDAARQQTKDSNAGQLLQRLNETLRDAFGFGEYLESGTVSVVQDPALSRCPIHIGDYIMLNLALSEFGRNMKDVLYYVESVAHDFRVALANTDGYYRTTLGVTRGEGFLSQFRK